MSDFLNWKLKISKTAANRRRLRLTWNIFKQFYVYTEYNARTEKENVLRSGSATVSLQNIIVC